MSGHEDFLKLLLRHQINIKAFIGSLVLDAHVRDDVFQEVALVLWQRFEDFDSRRSFGAWARGIAARKVLELRHKNARFPPVFAPATVQAVLEAYDRIEDTISRKADAMRECLKGLPDEARQLLTLRYEQDCRAEEIARQRGSTIDAIYQALSRIRARLEDCIRRRLVVEQGGA
jgi:RNA polymerase sigma-70 factor (ECF subfamily)